MASVLLGVRTYYEQECYERARRHVRQAREIAKKVAPHRAGSKPKYCSGVTLLEYMAFWNLIEAMYWRDKARASHR